MKVNRMNKLLGLVKLRYLILINSKRNMSLMDTEKDIDVLNKKLYDFGHMEFFENYNEFKDMIKDMKESEKKYFYLCHKNKQEKIILLLIILNQMTWFLILKKKMVELNVRLIKNMV